MQRTRILQKVIAAVGGLREFDLKNSYDNLSPLTVLALQYDNLYPTIYSYIITTKTAIADIENDAAIEPRKGKLKCPASRPP